MYSERSGQTRSRSFEHAYFSRLSMFYLSECFASLHVSSPTMFYLFSRFTPHVSRKSCFISTCFTHLICFTSHHVLSLCAFQIQSCFISLHVSRSTMFYLSARFKSIRVLSLCVFQVPPRLSLCMLQIPSCFIFLNISDPSIFYFSVCFTPVHVLSF